MDEPRMERALHQGPPDEPVYAARWTPPAAIDGRVALLLRSAMVAGTVAAALVVTMVAGWWLTEGPSLGPRPGSVRESPPLPARVVFVHDNDLDLYVVDVETGEQSVIETPEDEWDVAWSPDGTRIALTREVEAGAPPPDDCETPEECERGAPGRFELFVVDAAGTGERQVTDGGPRGAKWSPRWSPDGRSIAYIDPAGLAIIPADGGDPRHIFAGELGQAVWSPTANWLLVVSWGPDGAGDLYLVSPDPGVDPRQLTDDDIAQSITDGAWSPDGRGIVFWSDPDGSGRNPVVERFDVDTGARVTLAEDALLPAWSPTGRRIAYVSTAAGSSERALEAWVMDADGGNRHMIGSGRSPQWVDEARIIYRGPAVGELAVVNVDTGATTPLARDASLTWQVWGP